MRVNVWWLTIYPQGSNKMDWLYYSKDLKRDLGNSYMVLDDIAASKSDGSDYESSHYGIFELSEIIRISNKNGNLLREVR
jgi:hypothetical protein